MKVKERVQSLREFCTVNDVDLTHVQGHEYSVNEDKFRDIWLQGSRFRNLFASVDELDSHDYINLAGTNRLMDYRSTTK